MKIFQDKTVDLDLNGPILSFTTEPTGVGSTGVGINSTGGGSVELTGIATATFPTSATNAGYVTYRWYEQGVGALSDSTYVTGTATTTLTLTNLITPNDNQRKFYLQADYIPSYYVTGNATNDPFNSGIGTVTVDPLIEIGAQPANQTTLINSTTGVYDTGQFISFTADTSLSDSFFADDITYQWFIDGEAATDGVREKITETSSTVVGTIENTYTETTGPIIVPSSATDIEVVLAGGRGGTGGSDGNGPGGRGAEGRAGRFAMSDGAKDLHFYIGYAGDGGGSGGPTVGGGGGINPADPGFSEPTQVGGGNGGGAGERGWSGGGGGGGAGSHLTNNGSRILVAGGGGGGGGGSHNVAGEPGFGRRDNTGQFFGEGSLVRNERGGNGTTKRGDGGGGGGGGGGAWPSGSGGGSGQDNSHGGEAGEGGGSAWDMSVLSRVGSPNQWLNDGNGYGYLKYTGTTGASVTTTRKTTISGSTTKTLKVACDIVGVQTAQCKISSATASNSFVLTNEVAAVFVDNTAANTIQIESIGTTDTASLTEINLNNGEYAFNVEGVDADNNGINQFYVLYSPDKDMDVEMDLYGGKGANGQGGALGGEGGYSRIRFTLEQNQEYVIAGLISSVNTPFVYRRGLLMTCVGGGGDANNTPGQSGGNGGAGGGVNVTGQDGFGNGRGFGGNRIAAGSLGGSGVFGSAYTAPIVYPGDSQAGSNQGGRTLGCTKGVYWRQQGYGACDNVGTTGNEGRKFRLSDGTIVTNTTDTIERGFKAGYNIMQTAGVSLTSNGGNGGNGASGGQGASSSAGGGGGSGYNEGTVTVVSTQSGGNTGNAKVVLRLQS